MKSHQSTTSIDLIGGPFDGHSQPVAMALSDMARVIALPVNRNILGMLVGKFNSVPLPVRVAALYSRDKWNRRRYGFIGFCRPEDVEMSCREM